MSVSKGHSTREAGLTFASLLLIVAMISLLATAAIPPIVAFFHPSPDIGTQHERTTTGEVPVTRDMILVPVACEPILK